MKRDLARFDASHGRTLARASVLVFLAVLAALLGAARTVGQAPGSVVTDRPDQTESAESVPGGFVQLELGWTFARDQDALATQENHSLPQALLRVGLGGGIELRMGFSGFSFETRSARGALDQGTDASGAGDGELGLKLELATWTDGQIAVLGGFSIPLGRGDFSSGRLDPSVRLLVAHPLGERVSIGYNAGLAWTTESTASCCRDTQLEAPYTLALGVGLTDRLGMFIESFGAFGLTDDRDATHSFDGGFTFLVSDAFQLDVFVGLGLNEAAEDWFVGSGFSVRLPG